ncbi:MAG: hypothetical protein B6240_00060 [Desulfobacteraceae bacterium 4572_87]|nr:MAG: hypothetical protein B6240_00060 [Desulfobacteraceae bacterium 4572_87]
MTHIKEYFRVAQQKKATDIYFSVGSPPFLKIKGGLHPLKPHPALSKTEIDALAREILSPGNLSVFESRREVIDARTIDGLGRLRIVFSDEHKGPCMACRLIPLKIPELDNLGLPPVLKHMVSGDGGLILVIGRAGSGKTTTLAALINHINHHFQKSILTLEQPVEFIHTNQQSYIEQIPLCSPDVLLEKYLSNAFMQTADVLVMDALQPEETIPAALSAASNGLLVLVSVASNGGVAEVLKRIMDAFPAGVRNNQRHLLAGVLRGAIWQHLFPLKDSRKLTPAVEILINDPVMARLISRAGELHLLRPTMAAGRFNGNQTMHQALNTLKGKASVPEDIINDFQRAMLTHYVYSAKALF